MKQIEAERDIVLPETLKLIKRRLAVLKRYAAGGEEQARQATSQMRSLENSLKAYLGEYSGLLDKALISKKQKEESLAKTSVVDFVNATPSVKSQIQQTEVVKASLDAKSVQPEGDAPRPSAASSAPATAVLREVPAVQAVLRAKIEDQLTAFPELAAILEDLVSALSASIEETTAAAIRSRCAALLNALLPSLSGELQSAFVTQLEAIPQAIEKELETGDWEECCQNAGAILLTLLEQITDGATREVASRLGTGSHAPQKASAVDVEKGELTGLYGSRELCRKQRLQSWK